MRERSQTPVGRGNCDASSFPDGTDTPLDAGCGFVARGLSSGSAGRLPGCCAYGPGHDTQASSNVGLDRTPSRSYKDLRRGRIGSGGSRDERGSSAFLGLDFAIDNRDTRVTGGAIPRPAGGGEIAGKLSSSPPAVSLLPHCPIRSRTVSMSGRTLKAEPARRSSTLATSR